jgi:ferredoxin
MGHHTAGSYSRLQKRLDDHAQGAPASESLFRILEILFTKKEAELVSLLPIRFFTTGEAAMRWGTTEREARPVLETLADKGILFDFRKGETQAYLLAPTMAGFFEMSLMRAKNRFFDTRLLSEMYYQYINVEENFIKSVFGLDTPIYRIFVQEDTIRPDDRIVVLDYERASHIIRTASCITVSLCYCRHKMAHVGRACDMPQEVCLSLNRFAESLARHKIARTVSKGEALAVLAQCIDLGLVQLGDNVQEGVNWICNCCGCCCEALLAYKRLGHNPRIHSNFVARIEQTGCTGCGACVRRCPVEAVKLRSPARGKEYAVTDRDRCIGCGVCARFCSQRCITMERRKESGVAPVDGFERFVLNAIETGKLQNYIFDNYTLWTHEIMRRFLRFLLTLEPAKQLLAQRQIRSRFLTALTGTHKYTLFDRLHNEGRKPDYTHSDPKTG